MNAFMFYLNFRRLQILDPGSDQRGLGICEIPKIASSEWQKFTEGKKNDYKIPPEIQTKLRTQGKLNNLKEVSKVIL